MSPRREVEVIFLEDDDQVAAACLIRSEANGGAAQGTLIQYRPVGR